MQANTASGVTFLDLPFELREEIYYYALQRTIPAPNPILAPSLPKHDRNIVRVFPPVGGKHGPINWDGLGLLTTSKQIGAESLSVLYSKFAFEIWVEDLIITEDHETLGLNGLSKQNLAMIKFLRLKALHNLSVQSYIEDYTVDFDLSRLAHALPNLREMVYHIIWSVDTYKCPVGMSEERPAALPCVASANIPGVKYNFQAVDLLMTEILDPLEPFKYARKLTFEHSLYIPVLGRSPGSPFSEFPGSRLKERVEEVGLALEEAVEERRNDGQR